MPEYRIISVPVPAPTPSTRTITRVTAHDVVDAVAQMLADAQSSNSPQRHVLSVGEIPNARTYTDDEITAAFSDPNRNPEGPEPLIDPEEIDDDDVVFHSDYFLYTIDVIAHALRVSGIVPGLYALVMENLNGVVTHGKIMIRDDFHRVHLSKNVDLADLTQNDQAMGWDGILAIARALMDLGADLY